jgi:cell division protein FtsI (penicillin-binding protein 3)
VHLTIHIELQDIVEEALQRVVSLHSPEKATAIFMDPFTGEILAMANYPDFNLETREGNRRNFAIADRYEPGSTFKVISLAACYDSGVVDPEDEINCEWGHYYDEVLRFPLGDHHPYGMLTSGMVLAKSSNIGIYKMVRELGKHALHSYIRDFGFGSSTGIALTGEVAGLVHKPDSPNWSKTSLSRVGIGYEVDVTPLQMLNAMCAVANGGVLMQPQIVKKITDAYGEPSYELAPHKVRRVISEETADHLREAMLLVTGEDGTGKLAAVEGYPTAGKTGTARKPKKDRSQGYHDGRYVASFMGFLPAENPRLAGIVIVDDPVGKDSEGQNLSRYGGSVAGPVFREIAEKAMKYMEIQPSVIPRRAVRSKVPEVSVRYAPGSGG